MRLNWFKWEIQTPWTTKYTETLSDRDFVIQTNSEDDLRVRTTNSIESDASVYVDETSTMIGFPGVPGDTVDIEVESEPQVREDLGNVGVELPDQDKIVAALKRLGSHI